MNQPGRLLSLFTNVRAQSTNGASSDLTLEDATSITGSAAVDQVIATLQGHEIVRLLTHVRDWNTTARTSVVAQSVLHAVLKLRTAEDIMSAFEGRSVADELDEDADAPGDDDAKGGDDGQQQERKVSKWGKKKNAPPISLKELIDGLLPYTERHLARADKLVQDSYVVDYVLGEMDMGMLALGDGGEDENEDRDQDGVEIYAMDIDVAA